MQTTCQSQLQTAAWACVSDCHIARDSTDGSRGCKNICRNRRSISCGDCGGKPTSRQLVSLPDRQTYSQEIQASYSNHNGSTMWPKGTIDTQHRPNPNVDAIMQLPFHHAVNFGHVVRHSHHDSHGRVHDSSGSHHTAVHQYLPAGHQTESRILVHHY